MKNDKKIKKANCPQCGGVRRCYIYGYHKKIFHDDAYTHNTELFILECCGCEQAFIQRVDTNSEDIDTGYDEKGEPWWQPKEDVKYWPTASEHKMPDWIDSKFCDDRNKNQTLRTCLYEMYGAIGAELAILTSVGLRTCFDATTDILTINRKLTFTDKTAELLKNNLIDQSQKKRIDTLVDAGNAAAHRGWVPKNEEIIVLVSILEDFIKKAILDPINSERLSNEAKKIENKIPKR